MENFWSHCLTQTFCPTHRILMPTEPINDPGYKSCGNHNTIYIQDTQNTPNKTMEKYPDQNRCEDGASCRCVTVSTLEQLHKSTQLQFLWLIPCAKVNALK